MHFAPASFILRSVMHNYLLFSYTYDSSVFDECVFPTCYHIIFIQCGERDAQQQQSMYNMIRSRFSSGCK